MALWMLAALALAAPEVVIEADYRSYVDQAKFFLKKDWYVDAEAQLSLAVAHPDGRLDPEAWFLLARVRFELADLPGARDAADHALTQSRDDEQARQTEELLTFLQQRFGSLQLISTRAGVSTKIDVVLTSVLLDPQLKAYYTQIAGRLKEPVVLPLEIGLPAGSYTINEQVIQVGSGSAQSVPIALSALGLQTTELTISGGFGTWMGPQATHLLPSPGTELGVHVPFGTFVVGARGGWWVQPRDTPAGSCTGTAAGPWGSPLGSNSRTQHPWSSGEPPATESPRSPGSAAAAIPRAHVVPTTATAARSTYTVWATSPESRCRRC